MGSRFNQLAIPVSTVELLAPSPLPFTLARVFVCKGGCGTAVYSLELSAFWPSIEPYSHAPSTSPWDNLPRFYRSISGEAEGFAGDALHHLVGAEYNKCFQTGARWKT